MAEKKMQKKAWRIKYILMYFAVLFLLITAIVASVLNDFTGKIPVIIYESFILLFAVGIPVAVEINHKIDSKKEKVKYGVSREEYQEFLRQTKNCDFCAK